jgi:hypothetical protein
MKRTIRYSTVAVLVLLALGGCNGNGGRGCPAAMSECDGRCVSLQSDPDHCGSCDRVCPSADGASAGCAAGTCTLECYSGYVDLDGDMSNGCEYECYRRGEEQCNGRDDDCDGQVDNGETDGVPWDCVLDELTACTVLCDGVPIEGTGFCSLTCYSDDIAVCTLPPETCNGLDDDCDGEVDNGTTGGVPWDCAMGQDVPCHTPCDGPGESTGLGDCPGTCMTADVTTCFETCNACDDDGNGIVDDGETPAGVAWDCILGDPVTCQLDCDGVEVPGSAPCPSTCMAADATGCAFPDEELRCDRLDDNCNGEIDEDLFGKLFMESKVSDNPGTAVGRVDIAWTGSRYFVVWDQNASDLWEIYANRIDEDAAIRLDTIDVLPVTTGPHGARRAPSAAWSGSALGTVWIEDVGVSPDPDLKLMLVVTDDTGTPLLADNVRIGPDDAQAAEPETIPAGGGYAMTWVSRTAAGDRIDLAVAGTDGSLSVGPVTVSSTLSGKASPKIAWSGSLYAVAWAEDYNSSGNWEMFVSTVEPDGTVANGDVRVYSFMLDAMTYAAAWDGRRFCVAARGNLDGQPTLHLVVLDEDGTTPAAPVELVSASLADTAVDLLWDGSFLAMTWHEGASGSESVMFATIGVGPAVSDYAPLTPVLDVTTVPGGSSMPAMAWTGSRYGLAFRNTSAAAGPEAYHTVLGCP